MSGGLRALIDEVDAAHRQAGSVAELARATRDALRARIGAPEFKLDCLERILRSRNFLDGDRPWLNPSIHVDPRLNYAFRVFFWVPGYVNAPHKHNTWGVTGVLHNPCSVYVYRAQEPSGSERLAVDRRLVAEPGEVGYLLPGCVHSVGNPGASLSATFHVFTASPREDDRANDTVWYRRTAAAGAPAPRAREAFTERRNAMLIAAQMLGAIPGERSARLLEHVFALGGPRIRVACVRAMAAIDPERRLDAVPAVPPRAVPVS